MIVIYRRYPIKSDRDNRAVRWRGAPWTITPRQEAATRLMTRYLTITVSERGEQPGCSFCHYAVCPLLSRLSPPLVLVLTTGVLQ